MKNFSYNKASIEGLRMFRLIDAQYNAGTIGVAHAGRAFNQKKTTAVMRCRVNKVEFLMQSNTTGIRRPEIKLIGDVEVAWGMFSDDVGTLDFMHSDQELPINYREELNDDSCLALVEAGLFSDSRFEDLFTNVITDEVFDVEGEIETSNINISLDRDKPVSVIIAEPVSTEYDKENPSEMASVQDLIQRSANLVIAFKEREKEMGIEPEMFDNEVYIEDEFIDVFVEEEKEVKQKQEEKDAEDGYTAHAALLDDEIDVTLELQGISGFDATSDIDIIHELKVDADEKELSSLDGYEELTLDEKEALLSEIEAEKQASKRVVDMPKVDPKTEAKLKQIKPTKAKPKQKQPKRTKPKQNKPVQSEPVDDGPHM